jgi:hypothetical protein
LETLADHVAELDRDLRFRHVTPPGEDQVSRNVADQSDRMLTAGRAYLASLHNDLLDAVAALRVQIDAYEDGDQRNAARL